jgi:CxxC-x17-CxxC domain-containing protein
MFSAVCDKCGKSCQVPFQPTPGKPIYCEQCFGKDRGGDRGGAPKGDQLSSINAKLDKIINALIVAKIIKPFKEIKPEVKKPEVKKPEVKKSAKKAVAKKVGGKKKGKK